MEINTIVGKANITLFLMACDMMENMVTLALFSRMHSLCLLVKKRQVKTRLRNGPQNNWPVIF